MDGSQGYRTDCDKLDVASAKNATNNCSDKISFKIRKMKKELRMLAIVKSMAFLGFLFAAHGALAEVCYEEVKVPASLGCSTTDSRSADFALGCKQTGDSVELVEVKCPPPQAKWVNVTQKTFNTGPERTPSHASICSSVGMVPAKINGGVCASGTHRPDQGGDWSSINFKHSTTGAFGTVGTAMTKQTYQTDLNGKITGRTMIGYGRSCNKDRCLVYERVNCRGGENGSDYSNCDQLLTGYLHEGLFCTPMDGNTKSNGKNLRETDAVVAVACEFADTK